LLGVAGLSAIGQHQVGEREAGGETEGEAEDERQRGRRGRGGGSKAGVRVLVLVRKDNESGACRGGAREKGKERAPQPKMQGMAHCQTIARACVRAQLLDHALTRQRQHPAHSPAHHCWY